MFLDCEHTTTYSVKCALATLKTRDTPETRAWQKSILVLETLAAKKCSVMVHMREKSNIKPTCRPYKPLSYVITLVDCIFTFISSYHMLLSHAGYMLFHSLSCSPCCLVNTAHAHCSWLLWQHINIPPNWLAPHWIQSRWYINTVIDPLDPGCSRLSD